MANSKETILKAVRKQVLPPAELPTLNANWIKFPDTQAQFAKVLGNVGGQCVAVADEAAINEELSQRAAYVSAKKICSLVPNVGTSNVDLASIDDPHELEDVDVAILRGEFAVAENGAVWLTDAGLKHRVLPFLTQHLFLVVSADSIVDNLHEAYERLQFGERGFGVFISGPSKTADIEQSLVIGAHGARSLAVYVVGSHSPVQ